MPWRAASRSSSSAVADLAVVPADDRAGDQGRCDGVAVVLAGGGQDGVGQRAGELVAQPGQGLQVRGQRLVPQVARAAAAGPGPSGPGRRRPGPGRGRTGPRTGRTAAGPRRPAAAAWPAGHGRSGRPGPAAGRGQGFGGGHRAGQRARIGRRGQLQRAQRQVGRGMRRRTQRLRRRRVQPGQRRGVAGMRGLEQVTGGPGRGFAPAEQDLAVLAVQRLAGRPRDHLADGAAQQLVAEGERVVGGGHDPGVHRLLDRGQQRGRGFAEHLGRVFQPERRAQHRRRHQQVPGLLAEAIEPPLRDAVDPLRQPGRHQHGAAAGDLHGVIVAQAADQLGQQRGVPGGAASQGQQAPGPAARRTRR